MDTGGIRWGSYNDYEGPFFRGRAKFEVPPSPTDDEKILSVITATEGGAYDAINMYDRCIVSTGLIQFCEASYYSTSALLGSIFEVQANLVELLRPALDASRATFERKSSTKWRFYVAQNEVDTLPEQRRLFLLNSTGHRGSWDAASRDHARLWAASLATLLEQPAARSVQRRLTVERIRSFATPAALKVVANAESVSPLAAATAAIFYSYAVNLPAVASRHLLKAEEGAAGHKKWSESWCIALLKALVFGPGIAIWPHRYNAVRPVVERLFGVDLPDMAEQLKAWRSGFDSTLPDFGDVRTLQQLLVALGYDLGPAGADGVAGPKTRAAVKMFQQTNGLVPDGVVGPITVRALEVAWRRVSDAGLVA